MSKPEHALKRLSKNKLLSNASWLIAGKAVQSILSFVVTIWSARYFGPSNFGLITSAASVIAFFAPLAQLGLTNVMVQELIQRPDEEEKTMGTAMVMGILSSFLCVGLSTGFVFVLYRGERDTTLVTFLYSLSLVFQATEIIQYWYQAKLLSKYTSIVSLVAYILVSIYKIILLATQSSVYGFALAYSIDYAIISVALTIIYYRSGNRLGPISTERGKEMFKSSKYYIVASFMVAVFTQTDRLMLKGMMDNSAAGYYSAAVSCAGLTGFIINAIIDSARPAIFANQKKSEESFNNSVRILYSIIIYFCLLQSFFTMIFAKLIIHIIYGEAYHVAIPALRIATWMIAFQCLGTIRNIWMLAKQQQKYLVWINTAGGVANILLNLVLIRTMGVEGAAIATVISQCFTNIFMGYVIKPIRPNNRLMFESLNPKYMLMYINSIFKAAQ